MSELVKVSECVREREYRIVERRKCAHYCWTAREFFVRFKFRGEDLTFKNSIILGRRARRAALRCVLPRATNDSIQHSAIYCI